MKRAFDENVSRAKPRLRLGSLLQETEIGPTAENSVEPAGPEELSPVDFTPAAVAPEQTPPHVYRTLEEVKQAISTPAPAPVRPSLSLPPQVAETSPSERRERLKERLRAVRENPRPEPLPATVTETGMLAVERIAMLQNELGKLKTLNLALTQDLESTRRQAEKANDEARSRVEEAQRLSSEMEARARLLSELEKELAALEGERDEVLLSLQDARHRMDAVALEQENLRIDLQKKDKALEESLAEEERLAIELEDARKDSDSLRQSVDALNTERDMLAKQVTSLTSERVELLEARKALESVHRALSQAARA